jgi:predicted lipoprotein with Yx(FWY)xxD motif
MYSTRSRLAVSLAGLGVLALAAACGSDIASGSGSQYGAPLTGNAAGSGQGATNSSTISVQTVGGSMMLVGPTGAALYTNDQDSGGKPKCVSSDCTAIWIPLSVPAGQQPSAAAGVGGTIATVALPSGKDQVTLNGKPLYTFALDAQPGQVHGNGVGDSFAGTHFTWHSAVPAGATAPSAPASAPANNFPPGY